MQEPAPEPTEPPTLDLAALGDAIAEGLWNRREKEPKPDPAPKPDLEPKPDPEPDPTPPLPKPDPEPEPDEPPKSKADRPGWASWLDRKIGA